MTNTAPHELDLEEAQRILQLHFGLDKMEAYYLYFKENRSIIVEAQFKVASFKHYFLDIYNQIGIRDWGPFTIPMGPYFPELGQEMPITLEAINSIYWDNPTWPSLEFKRKVEDKKNQFKWVTKIIARDQPQCADSQGIIYRHDLKFKARMWLD
ncbi:hypothetical protein HAX54_017201 [Datura stramonium]|uniref:Uncharacterized protein n=1 Tax=Datura stramonium TaxID=4076 RepID=A0ABS8S3T7_DATST|nr:hypothetical protein [Datura stramonium]